MQKYFYFINFIIKYLSYNCISKKLKNGVLLRITSQIKTKYKPYLHHLMRN